MSNIDTPGTEETLNGTYFIENVETKRYVFQDGNPIAGKRGDEGGWKASSGFESPKVVGADANYYNRAFYKITHTGNGRHLIENVETKRYLSQDGKSVEGKRGDEGGWLSSSGFQSPQVVGADANYYNRALWRILRQSNGSYFIENVETKRYLFQDGPPIKGKRGDEGGWLANSGFESPNVVGADANYYNRAYFKLIESVPSSERKVTPSQNKEEEEKMKGMEKSKEEEEKEKKAIEEDTKEEKNTVKRRKTGKKEEEEKMKGVEENTKEEKKKIKKREKATKKEDEKIKKWALEITEQIFGCCNVTCLKFFVVLIVTLFILYLFFYFIRG